MLFAKRSLLRFLAPWALAFALVASGCADDGASAYQITHEFSNVSFRITKIFFTEEGGFRDYSGEIYFDPAHPERSRVQMTVQAASIDTRVEGRDRVLRSEDFFDTGRYPTLTFVSTSVNAKPGGLLEVTGDLTIHGVTRRITIPIRFLGTRKTENRGDIVGFDTEFTIDRTEFGVNGSRWSGGALILSKEVNIHRAIGAIGHGAQ
jgi:polyisoprenoid-binding protein YceI